MARRSVVTLGDRIRLLRAHGGVTGRELDWLADLHACHSALVEKSGSDRVSTLTLSKIADVFGVSLDWLYRGQGPAPALEDVRACVARARARRPRAVRKAS